MSMYERKKLTRWQRTAQRHLDQPMTALQLSLKLASIGLFYDDHGVRNNLRTLLKQDFITRVSGQGTTKSPYYYQLKNPTD